MLLLIKPKLSLLPVLIVGLFVTILSGCDNYAPTEQNEEVATQQALLTPNSSKPQRLADKQSSVEFAPTVTESRKGQWRGGAAPINKQQSGVNSYYKLKQSRTSEDRLTMTLRFEGIDAEDAAVEIKLLDGASFVDNKQTTRWRLEPNKVSQVSFDIIVPADKPSYLALTTVQHNLAAARAFVLETTY